MPILSVEQPLFAFANVVYKWKQSESEPHARPTERFALSSMLHTVAPKEVAVNGAEATDKADPVIDDFTHGWRDWYKLLPRQPASLGVLDQKADRSKVAWTARAEARSRGSGR